MAGQLGWLDLGEVGLQLASSTASVSLASRASSLSPTQRIGSRPAASAAWTFKASASSVSQKSLAPLGVTEDHRIHIEPQPASGPRPRR